MGHHLQPSILRCIGGDIDGMAARTGKCLLDVHHLPRARLHEAILSTPRPLQPFSCADLPLALQIAFVSRDNAYRLCHASFQSRLSLHLDQLIEVF